MCKNLKLYYLAFKNKSFENCVKMTDLFKTSFTGEEKKKLRTKCNRTFSTLCTGTHSLYGCDAPLLAVNHNTKIFHNNTAETETL
jgi:hypothetical protein